MKHNILVIDDDPIVCRILEKGLMDMFNVTLSSHAVEAIKLLKENYYSLVITDFSMPDINGFELLVWLKNNMQMVKVIVLTSYDTNDLKELILSIGAIKFFTKPADVKQVKNFIIEYLNSGFEGDIKNLDINQIIQSYLFQGKKVILTIKDSKSDIKGEIYIKNGELIRIIAGSNKNEQALADILEINDGYFVEDSYDEEINKEINVPYQALLMQAAYIIDNRNDLNQSSKPIKSIVLLLSKENEKFKMILQKTLSIQNFHFVALDEFLELAEIIKTTRFDLIISDHSFIKDLLEMKNNNLELIVIKSEQFQNQVNEKFKNFDLIEISNYLKNNRNVGLTGNLKNIGFFDLIQLISSPFQTKVLEIKNFKEKLTGKIFLKKGVLVHCEYNNLIGQEAIYEIINIKKGMFFEKIWSEPKEYSMSQKNLSSVLIKYLGGLKINSNFDPKLLEAVEEKVNLLI